MYKNQKSKNIKNKNNNFNHNNNQNSNTNIIDAGAKPLVNYEDDFSV